MWTLLFWKTSQSKQSQTCSSLWVMKLIFVQSVCFETNISIGLFVTKINPPLRKGNVCLVWSSTSSTWSLIGVALNIKGKVNVGKENFYDWVWCFFSNHFTEECCEAVNRWIYLWWRDRVCGDCQRGLQHMQFAHTIVNVWMTRGACLLNGWKTER